jgi:hypothetical protein
MKTWRRAFLLSFSLLPAVAGAETPPTCFETLRELTPELSADLTCVSRAAPHAYLRLCDRNGFNPSPLLQTYLDLREKHLTVKAEAQAWLQANPGSTDIPASLVGRLIYTENAWNENGRREVDEDLATLLRGSAQCR